MYYVCFPVENAILPPQTIGTLFIRRVQVLRNGPGGGSSPIFVRACATWGSQTPPFDKARQRRNFDPVLRQILEKVSKKCLKMYDSLDFRKILRLKLAKHAFLGVKLQFSAKKDPFVRHFWGQKGTLL